MLFQKVVLIVRLFVIRFGMQFATVVTLCLLHALAACCAGETTEVSSSLLGSLRDPGAERLERLDKSFIEALGLDRSTPLSPDAASNDNPSRDGSADAPQTSQLPNLLAPPPAPPQVADNASLLLPPTVDPRNDMLRGFVSTALANSPELCVARANICALQGKWVQVGLRPNPSIGLSAQEVGNDGGLGQWGMQINKRISRGNKLGLNRNIVCHEIEQLRVQLRIDSARLRNDVERAFFQAVTAAHRAYVLKQLADMAEETLGRVQKGLNAKELPRADLLQAELDFEAARMESEAAADTYRSELRRMSALLHICDDELQDLTGDAVGALPDFPWNATLCEMLQNSPAVQKQFYAIEAAKCTVARQEAQRIPDLNLGLTVAYDDESNDPFASFNIGRPLLIHDDNRGAIQQAKGQLTAACCELEVVQQRSREKLAAAMRRYEGARRRVHRYTTSVLPRALELLDLIRKAAFAGEGDFSRYHVAQREYAQYYKDFLDALEDSWEYHWEVRNLLDGVTAI